LDADFIDARSGKIAWTRTFTGKTHAVMQGDSEVVYDISLEIGRALLKASIELAFSNPLPQIQSHALFMSAISLMHRHQLAEFSRSRVFLEELIKRSPNYSFLHAWLAKWYILAISQGCLPPVAA
jgi:hypothetical protein